MPKKSPPSPDSFRTTWKKWEPGDLLAINRIQWDQCDYEAVMDVFQRDWFAQGHYVAAFSAALADFIGQPSQNVVLTNSGSSALDIAIKALIETGFVRKGDLALHPALTFNTSATCIINNGLFPVFVDSVAGTYNINPEQAVAAIEKYNIKLVVLPHILGNMTNLSLIEDACFRRSIPIIADSCDTLGARWRDSELSYHAFLTAYSFYASHHITAGGVGGALVVDDVAKHDLPAMPDYMKSLVHWGRDFSRKDFNGRYAYLTLGTDSQMSELQAAFGLAQIKKLPALNERRQVVFATIHETMKRWESDLILPFAYPEASPSWFAYPITIRAAERIDLRPRILHQLEKRKIETRPMFSGNTLKQKAWINVPHIIACPTPVADHTYSHTFFVPAWPMPDDALSYLLESLTVAMKEVG